MFSFLATYLASGTLTMLWNALLKKQTMSQLIWSAFNGGSVKMCPSVAWDVAGSIAGLANQR